MLRTRNAVPSWLVTECTSVTALGCAQVLWCSQAKKKAIRQVNKGLGGRKDGQGGENVFSGKIKKRVTTESIACTHADVTNAPLIRPWSVSRSEGVNNPNLVVNHRLERVLMPVC